jgi:hypothetical protein
MSHGAQVIVAESQEHVDRLDAIISKPFDGTTVAEFHNWLRAIQTAYAMRATVTKQSIAPRTQYLSIKKLINAIPAFANPLQQHINTQDDLTVQTLIDYNFRREN